MHPCAVSASRDDPGAVIPRWSPPKAITPSDTQVETRPTPDRSRCRCFFSRSWCCPTDGRRPSAQSTRYHIDLFHHCAPPGTASPRQSIDRRYRNGIRPCRRSDAATAAGSAIKVPSSAPASSSHSEQHGRCDDATEQDQADVARREMRDAGLALRIARLHRRGHGAPGLRCAVRRPAARHRPR